MKLMPWGMMAAMLLLGGCAKTQYTWADYGSTMQSMYSGSDKQDVTAARLQKIIEKGEVNGTVPPGIYAEYGYVLMSSGNAKEAAVYFEKEKQLYPEAAFFMNKMIELTKSGPKAKPTAFNINREVNHAEIG